MLASLNQLKKRKDFDITFKKGISTYSKILGIKILKNNSILENRNKSPRRADAVLSNDMKEKIYETFRTDFELLGYKK